MTRKPYCTTETFSSMEGFQCFVFWPQPPLDTVCSFMDVSADAVMWLSDMYNFGGADLEGGFHQVAPLVSRLGLSRRRQGWLGDQGGGAPAQVQGLAVAEGACVHPLAASLALAVLGGMAQHLELRRRRQCQILSSFC